MDRIQHLKADLYDAICDLPVIDAHEHLTTEADYLNARYSGLNLFAGGYIWHDLESAGMSPEFKATMRTGVDRPVSEWWPVIRPHWEHVRHTSFAAALRITARDLFGIDDINDDTIHSLAECVRADNRPGLYHRVLSERCGIERCITVTDNPAFPEDPLLVGVTKISKTWDPDPLGGVVRRMPDGAAAINDLAVRAGREIVCLDDAVAAVQGLLAADVAAGAVGFKFYMRSVAEPDRLRADAELQAALREGAAAGECPLLRDYLFERSLDVAAEARVPVAVHSGYWGDYRDSDPKHIFSFALRRRDVCFDLFHLGWPMIQDAILIGKSLPNVTLNLCWTPLISQRQTARALDDLIDMVPANKIIAFGGDYRAAVHKVYGHLVMTREIVAGVLAARIEAGSFDFVRALRLARLWLHDNPAAIYKLDV